MKKYITCFALLAIVAGFVATDASAQSIKNRRGFKWHHNSIAQSGQKSATADSSAFDLGDISGIMVLPLGTNATVTTSDQPFDSQIERMGKQIAAKVMLVPDIDNDSKIYVRAYNNARVVNNVEIWHPSSTGQLTLVSTVKYDDIDGSLAVVTRNCLDQAIIVVYPVSGDLGDQRLELEVGRIY